MRAARNIAIIMLLAFIVAAVPGGGEVADGVTAAITITFLGLIAFAAWFSYRQNRYTYLGLTEQSRTILVASVGGIVLSLAGMDDLNDTSLGLLLFLVLLGASIAGIIRVVTEVRSAY